MEYIKEQVTILGGYIKDSLSVLNDTGAIVLLIVLAVIMVLVAVPRIKK